MVDPPIVWALQWDVDPLLEAGGCGQIFQQGGWVAIGYCGKRRDGTR